jgi:hypothetical protein
MKIKCRILNINEEDHSFSVRFYRDCLTEEELCSSFDEKGRIQCHENGYPLSTITDVNMNFYDNLNPTEEDLIKILLDIAPYHYFFLRENVKKNNTNTSKIKKFIGEEIEIEVDPDSKIL